MGIRAFMIGEPLAPSSPMIEVLTPIWQRVLRLPSIRVEDNFFDLGGDSSAATELFREISRVCGLELPPVMICQSPTIATLAALLAQPGTPHVPALVPLKAGADEPPIFIGHGMGDTVLGLVRLARQIESSHPVLGLQARGVDGMEAPLDSIEAMAQFHVEAIRQMQPHGPYFLVGYSLGGLVTLEIARRLSEGGEEIALLAMLDSYPHARHLPTGQRARLTLRLARRRALTAMQSLKYGGRSPISASPGGNSAFDPVMQRMRTNDDVAWKRYQPQFYRGKIKFVKAVISSFFPDNPAAVWSHLAEEFAVETVPGDHMEMLTSYSGNLAAVVSRYLRDASSTLRS